MLMFAGCLLLLIAFSAKSDPDLLYVGLSIICFVADRFLDAWEARK